MGLFVNVANSGNPLGGGVLKHLESLGVHGTRTDILPEGAEAQFDEFTVWNSCGLRPIALIGGGHMNLTEESLKSEAKHAAIISKQTGCDVFGFEIGNEPNAGNDRWRKDPELFGSTVAECAAIIWEELGEEQLVISGGVHNPGKDAQSYIEKAERFFPTERGNFMVGFHFYPPGMWDPRVVHDGFNTNEEMIQSLRLRAGFRPIIDTESGCHQTPTKDFPIRHDDQHASMNIRRLNILKACGVEHSSLYNYRNGEDAKDKENTFGIWRFDDSEKPVAGAIRRYLNHDPLAAPGGMGEPEKPKRKKGKKRRRDAQRDKGPPT